ncbi:MAG: class I SAM-dependent methyltransferase [Actinomycetota bacterium]
MTSDTGLDPTAGTETFDISLETAEQYERRFVPAIFARWAPHVLDAVEVSAGTRLLDVACGTGIVARTALERGVGVTDIVGIDLNPSMLAVARRSGPGVEWRQGDVVDLPVDDSSFDAVTCQMAMMFFPDRAGAWTEMARAVRPGGRVGVVVPASLEEQTAYRSFVEAAIRRAGPEARDLVSAYWNCGDLDALTAEHRSSGLDLVVSRTLTEPARFASCADFVATEIDATPLAERLDQDQRDQITADVESDLDWIQPTDAGFDVPLTCHVLAATRR